MHQNTQIPHFGNSTHNNSGNNHIQHQQVINLESGPEDNSLNIHTNNKNNPNQINIQNNIEKVNHKNDHQDGSTKKNTSNNNQK